LRRLVDYDRDWLFGDDRLEGIFVRRFPDRSFFRILLPQQCKRPQECWFIPRQTEDPALLLSDTAVVGKLELIGMRGWK